MEHKYICSKTGKSYTAKEYYMHEALKEACKAYKKGEVPVGAVIVYRDAIISRGHNEKEIKMDATHHAEMSALRKAYKKLGSWRLSECEMYVTLEPCPMCAGALIQSRLGKLYIGTMDPKAGAVGSILNLLSIDAFNHQVEVETGLLQEECSEILKSFFKLLRENKIDKRKY